MWLKLGLLGAARLQTPLCIYTTQVAVTATPHSDAESESVERSILV